MEKGLEKIVKEMCNRVGADFDSIDFKAEDWYYQYEWTMEEQRDYGDWLVNQLRTDKQVRKDVLEYPNKLSLKQAKHVAMMFIFNFGWKIKGMVV